MSESTSRIALVAGGNRGLGRSIAESLAQEGAGVVITYRSHREEAEEVLSGRRRSGARAAALRLDTMATAPLLTRNVTSSAAQR